MNLMRLLDTIIVRPTSNTIFSFHTGDEKKVRPRGLGLPFFYFRFQYQAYKTQYIKRRSISRLLPCNVNNYLNFKTIISQFVVCL